MNILMRPSVYLPAYLNLDFVIISMFFSVCISLSYFDTHTHTELPAYIDVCVDAYVVQVHAHEM